MSQFPAGVLTGKQVSDVWAHAKQHRYALPAVNVIGSNSINAVMETAKAVNSPVIIQFSNGGAKFNAGKSLSLDDQGAAVLGAVARVSGSLAVGLQLVVGGRRFPCLRQSIAQQNIASGARH